MIRLVALLAFLASCAHTWAPTKPPGTTADDLFTGQVVSCSEQVENAPVFSIAHCSEALEVESLDSCMVGVGQVRGVREVICTAQNLSQDMHIDAKKGHEDTAAHAAALDSWFRRHGIFVMGD